MPPKKGGIEAFACVSVLIVGKSAQLAHNFVVCGFGVKVEADYLHIFKAGVLLKIFDDGVDCDFRGLCKGKTVRTGGNGGEHNGIAVVFNGKVKAFYIALTEQLRFVGKTVVPNGAYGMDNIFCVKLKSGSNNGFAGFAAAELTAAADKLRTRGAMNCAVNAVAAYKAGICGINYCVNLHIYDIAFNNGEI